MFGITALGNSVAIHVHNFTPYFYVKINDNARVSFGADDLLAIKDQLNLWLNNSQGGEGASGHSY